MDGIEILLMAAPGLILFLYGMENFSREIQQVAGERFRSFLQAATKNTIRGTILGAAVTGIVQSSTAVSVIIIGLVDSGLISFSQSLAVIFGAGIGTTLTAQLVAFKFTALGPIFIPIGFLISISGRRFSFLGKPIFYFGLVFFGIGLISAAMAPLRDDPQIISYLSRLDNVFLAILAGFLITNIFQSSSVFTGLVVVLAQDGFIAPEHTIPLILGSNLGTITPLIAGFTLGLFAKRSAVAQMLFNAISVLLFLPFLGPFTSFVISLGGGSGQQAANAHTLFNVISTAAFLLILRPFAGLVERIVPGKEAEILLRTEALDEELPRENDVAFSQMESELCNLLSKTDAVLEESAAMLGGVGRRPFQRLLKRESVNDYLNKRIQEAVLTISKRQLSREEAMQTILIGRMSNALEQIADFTAGIAYASQAMSSRGMSLSGGALDELQAIHMRLKEDLRLVGADFPKISDANVAAMQKNEIVLRERINSAYSGHLKRLQAGEAYSPSTFIKVLSRMESAHAKIREIRKLCEAYQKL